MQIPKGGRSDQLAVWQLHGMWLKICSSHLSCKVPNTCLDVPKWVEVVEKNKDGHLLFPTVLRIVIVCERKPW